MANKATSGDVLFTKKHFPSKKQCVILYGLIEFYRAGDSIHRVCGIRLKERSL